MRWHPFRFLGLKVAALALGILLWFIVSGQEIERSVSVPVLYLHTPTDLQITGRPLQEVNVHIRGGYSQISQLGRNDVALIADLVDAKEGAVVLALTPNNVSAPLGVEATQVDPGSVTVMLERAGHALMSVRPLIEGQPAPGYSIGAVVADPPTVFVFGPDSHLKAMTSVTTEPVSIEGATKDVTQVVNIGITDSELRLKDVRVARVTVRIVRKPGH
jgi:YbbR domain-containing protein